VPAYVIFSDATLWEMAVNRPTTSEAMSGIRGVGEHKLADLGPHFLAEIGGYLGTAPLPPSTSSETVSAAAVSR
jgi:ATP-dependent DNA helicase RecQ